MDASVKQIDYFSLDGPLSLTLVGLAGFIVVLLFAWLLKREAGVLGSRYACLFFALRSLALATVLWMLLAPMNIRVVTSTTKRAVAVGTDASGSMKTIDPAGTADEVRWSIATRPSSAPSLVTSADQAVAALGVTQQTLQKATQALRNHQPESRIFETLLAAHRGIERAGQALQTIESTALGKPDNAKSFAMASRIAKLLEAAEFADFERLCAAVAKGRSPAQKGWQESLADLEHRIAGLRRSLQELARQTELEERERLAKDAPEQIKSVQALTRSDRAQQLLQTLQPTAFAKAQTQADIQFSTFEEPTAPNTDLSAPLQTLQREHADQPLAAVFVISDVAHNASTAENPRDVAAAFPETPIFVVPIGNTDHVRDVVLRSVYAPEVAMRNDDIVIEANIQAYNCSGETCWVQLFQGDERVDQQEIAFDSDFAGRLVRFEKSMPTIGSQKLRVAVAPIKGESSEDNNASEFEVNVTRRDIKILIADELPRWEYRYLTQLFRRDPKVQCDELLFHPRMIATGQREASQTLPVTVDEWDQYDVVILGDLPLNHFPNASQTSLNQYLTKRGGTLVLIAGSEAMPHAFANQPLADFVPVMPLQESHTPSKGYAFRVTAEGRNHHALTIGETDDATRAAWDFVNQFSPLHSLSTWRKPRPSAHSLIAAVPRDSLDEEAAMAESSFLTWQAIGRGRVVYLAGPDTYRLRFLRGDRLHFRFWGQLLRWAIASDLSSGSKFVQVRSDKTRYETRETVNVSVRLLDAEGAPISSKAIELHVASDNDERKVPLVPSETTPGEYRADIRSLPAGEYKIEPIGQAIDELQQGVEEEKASVVFTVREEVSHELTDTRADRGLAQQLADATGGQVLPPTAVAEVLQLLKLDPIISEKTETKPLWLEWKYLWLVFGCLQTEWIIRKWKGWS